MKQLKLALLLLFSSFSITMTAQTMDDVIAKFNEGAEDVNKGDFVTAIEHFNQLIEMSETVGEEANELKSKSQDQLPLLHYQVAIGFMKQKDYESAIPYLIKTVELSEQYGNNDEYRQKAMRYLPQLLTGVGTQKFKTGDLQAAGTMFDDAINYAPEYPKAYLGKGLVLKAEYAEEEMISTLTKAIELGKAKNDTETVEDAQSALGSYFTEMGNIELEDMDPAAEDFSWAIDAFENALKYDPDNMDANWKLAMIYNRMVEYDKAIDYALAALESAEDEVKIAAINLELGNGYFGTAEYDKACEAYNNAMVPPIEDRAIARKERVPGCE